ncbi:MAG: phosphate signaling complex protein PhoU [Geminicoccaceae bacterium]
MIGDVPVRRHTVRGFDEDLAELTGKVVAMGGLVERQLGASVEALMHHDSAAAEQVIADDDQVDALEEAIDRLAIRLLATRQPLAVDLRVVAMALKITNDLERMGDYAVNIAKRVRRIAVQPQIKPFLTIPLMAGICRAMLKDVLDAYIERDDRKALAVWHRDPEVDDYYDQLFRELLAQTLAEPRQTGVCVDLMFVAKNLERIGDHATNIAEKIHYMVHGDELNRPRSEVP